MSDRPQRPGTAKDRGGTAVTAVLFATASGALSVLVPLLMLADGLSLAVVGVVTIVAGLAQLLMRLLTAQLMRFVPDRALVCAACVLVGVGSGLAWTSSAVAAMVIVQLTHGVARALFWTGLQTHSVRTDDTAVRGMATVNLFAGVGLMAGPAIVGWMLHVWDFGTTLLFSVVIGVLGAPTSLFIQRLPPFTTRHGTISTTVWTTNTRLGSWMSGVAGGWKGLLDSYVPVLLVAQAYAESTTSLLIATSSGAVLLGTLLATRASGVAASRLHLIGVLLTAGALATVGLFGSFLPTAIVALAIGGTVSGVLQHGRARDRGGIGRVQPTRRCDSGNWNLPFRRHARPAGNHGSSCLDHSDRQPVRLDRRWCPGRTGAIENMEGR